MINFILALLFLLPQELAVYAGPDQTIQLKSSQWTPVRLNGLVKNGLYIWSVVGTTDARMVNVKTLTPTLMVRRPGVYKIWLIGSRPNQIKSDIVTITVVEEEK